MYRADGFAYCTFPADGGMPPDTDKMDTASVLHIVASVLYIGLSIAGYA